MLYRIERVLTCIPWHPRNFIVDAEQKVSIRTSWGRHKNVRTPDWPCPHQFYKFWLDFFTRCSSCTSRRIECRPYGVFFFLSRDMTDPTTRKKNKIDQNYSKKTKKSNRADTQSLWTYGSNTGLKIQCKILKIERGIAEKPFFSKLLDLYMESSFGNISWWVANWATRLTSIFSLSLQYCLHQILSWSKKTIFTRI